MRSFGTGGAGLRLRGMDEAPVATWAVSKPDAGKLKPDFQSPKPMPMALAVRTTSPFGFTDFRWPMAWAMSTETTDSPRRATIMPKPPAAMRSTAATPKRVASMRSKGEGVPPRWMWPSTLMRTSLSQARPRAFPIRLATESVRRALASHGFVNLKPWGRGVDTKLFNPSFRSIDAYDVKRPIFLTVSRIAVEKNLPAFLDLDLPGSKVVVGTGPQLAELKRRYPDVHFLGHRENGVLARLYASADVFVFPSRTDTFGLVILEALASGLPVAAYPVPGPLDVIGRSGAGVLDEDLRKAALGALSISSAHCRDYALKFTWAACAKQFAAQLSPAR